MGAGAAAHRSRRGRGPRGRAGRRRRRLSRQALLVRGAVGSPARARAARRSRATGGAGGGQPSARSRDAARLARPGGDRAVLQGVRAARGVPAPSGRGAEPPRPARARLGHRLREPLERGRRLRALPAREGRPPVRRREHRDGARRGLPAPRGRRRSSVTRLPIRVRLTLGFTALMAALLAAVGAFVYVQVRSDLDESLDNGLRSRGDELAALAGSGGRLDATGGRLSEAEESFAQILDVSGRVVDGTPPLEARPSLSRDELAVARRGPLFVDRDSFPGLDDPVRLLARPAGGGTVVVAGAGRDDRDEALAALSSVLLFGGPLALALAALAGWALTGAALRPVAAMRAQAASISRLGSSSRLPVSPARDELAALGRTLNEMLDRLERSTERERGFVASASHELRTPLALMKGELELALREGRTPEELHVLARADEGRLPVRRERLDAGELLASVARRFQSRLPVAVADDGHGIVEADRLRIEQALGNLVDNALRHGGRPVTLSAERADGALRLSVTDRGPGFPPELLDHAFERFTRGDAARSRGGAGLGLAIVDAIARAHGGSAGVVNLDAGGAKAWIELPRAAVNSPG